MRVVDEQRLAGDPPVERVDDRELVAVRRRAEQLARDPVGELALELRARSTGASARAAAQSSSAVLPMPASPSISTRVGVIDFTPMGE
jgi:hypothetical protein